MARPQTRVGRLKAKASRFEIRCSVPILVIPLVWALGGAGFAEIIDLSHSFHGLKDTVLPQACRSPSILPSPALRLPDVLQTHLIMRVAAKISVTNTRVKSSRTKARKQTRKTSTKKNMAKWLVRLGATKARARNPERKTSKFQ
jgi:hypothetical protein